MDSTLSKRLYDALGFREDFTPTDEQLVEGAEILRRRYANLQHERDRFWWKLMAIQRISNPHSDAGATQGA